MALAEIAASAVLARRGDLRPAHVHVRYLRAAEPGEVSAVARPVHVGRSFGLAEVTGSDSGGKLCMTATVTGRLWEGGHDGGTDQSRG
ncbi:thioesterase family protein [Amycolatopsis acidiphila]|uniref:Acyl-CoA thioesterase-like N-terminal HotDog domain-containing protein n=1 Tax=Amycolatopsis acidiphila TaxID=715473 RepID=A0A558AHX0_9PSEU|nr:hypothetical protein FNH06_08200 [Amycolatopsis acidiphila]UIJ61185.1 thioesterase family protein [Amycolatopsis acidiphila]